MDINKVYHELFRPQLHFTAKKNWLNDPNGLVYYKGRYHLFFQYNPHGIEWGPNSWGHAVSTDLVHWKQLTDAIEPDDYGHIWSGSAVVDWNNTAGFKTGMEDPIVAIYTTGSPLRNTPVVQAIAYSTDCGDTWIKYKDNPVIGHICGENRDPKVIWHPPTQRWIMALYMDQNDYALFGSPDLKHWTHLSDVSLPGTSECPDFFPLAVDGNPNHIKWVFWGAKGTYQVGLFNGITFLPEQATFQAEFGRNGYAAQTWSDIPAFDGRTIQISWMRDDGMVGSYPYMPFNQQMSFPVQLELRSFPEGIRLCRKPVKEIELLHNTKMSWKNLVIDDGKNYIPDIKEGLFDIRAEIDMRGAEKFGLTIHGIDLEYTTNLSSFTYLGHKIPISVPSGHLELQILVDRSSLELFAQNGKYSASFCFLPHAKDFPIIFYAVGGAINLVNLEVHTLNSIWD
jgi:fructan beta-fructosidase